MGMVVVMFFLEVIIGIFNKDFEFMNIFVNGLRIYLFMLLIVGLLVIGINFI